MNLELACVSSCLSYKDLQDCIHIAVLKNFSSVVVPAGYASRAQSLSQYISILPIVDFPHGNNTTDSKIHSILQIGKLQLKTLDVVLNHTHLLNDDWKAFGHDVRSCMIASQKNHMTVRFILDYRHFDSERIFEIVKILARLNVAGVVTSTGSIADDPEENIWISEMLTSKFNVPIICACQGFKEKHASLIKDSKVHGMRFFSHKYVSYAFQDA